MRIGIDCRLFNQSGVGRYIRNLVENLGKIDKENEYTLFFKEKEYKEVEGPSKNFQKRLANIPWHSFEEQTGFAKILEKEELDLVHFPYIAVPLNYKKKFVLTIHDLIPYHFSTAKASTLPFPLYQVKQWGYKYVIKKAALKAERIFTPSHASKKDILQTLNIDPVKIVVTYEGGFEGEIKKKEKKENYFLYVGNFYPHKNVKLLLHSFSEILKDFENNKKKTDIKLVLVGTDDLFYKHIKEYARLLKIEKNTEFVFSATDEKLKSLYAKALAFITASKIEGFGLPVLEAMQNGCLVIVSSIPVFFELCADAALYFDPTSPKDLTDKMKLVVYGNSFQSKVELGIAIAKNFSWNKMASETLREYKEILK